MATGALAAVSLGGSLIQGIAGAGAAKEQAAAQAASDRYGAAVATLNAQQAEANADRTIQQGEGQVVVAGKRTAATVGAQRAALGASGVDVNSGSALQDQDDAERAGRLDALYLMDRVNNAAYAGRVQAANYRNEATLKLMGASNAERAGSIAATSSLLGAAGSFGSKWLSYSRTGALPSFGGDL